jgi:hypothetical protein
MNTQETLGMRAARAHLAEGISLKAAGDRFGITREAVRQAKVKLAAMAAKESL